MIVQIAAVFSKYFEKIGAIGSFHMIVSITSKARENGWFLFVKRTSYLGISFFSWFCCIEKLEEFPEDVVSLRKLDVTDFL